MSAKLASSPANVKAVVGVEPDFITTSPPEFVILPKVVPSSLRSISAPPASKVMSATESSVISPESVDCIVTPV